MIFLLFLVLFIIDIFFYSILWVFMRFIFYLFFVVSLFFCLPFLYCHDLKYNFLANNSPAGVRSLAMGHAFIVGDDVASFSHNPASLGNFNWAYISLNFNTFLRGNYYNSSILFADPILDDEKLGYGIYFRWFDFSNFNDDFISKSIISGDAWVLYFAIAAKSLGDDYFFYGANFKILYSNLRDFKAFGGGSDVGFLFLPSFFAIGIVVQDVVTFIQDDFNGELNYYDPILKFGFSTRFSEKDPWKLSLQFERNLNDVSRGLIFRVGGYIVLWKSPLNDDLIDFQNFKGNFDQGLSKFNDFKVFPRALYLNFGYFNDRLSFGFTLALFKSKFDFAFSFSEFDKFNDFILAFSIDFAIY